MQDPGSAFPAFAERVAAHRKAHGYAVIDYRETTGSTNSDALALLGDSTRAGTTIAADYQTAGAGRKGRSWVAAPGSALLFTTLLRNALDPLALWALPLWTALAVAHGIERACGVRVALKWPNDLLVGERKCGGILCLSRVSGERAHAACGIGIDVIRPSDPQATAAIEPPPGFLGDLAPGLEREAVLAAILDRFATDDAALARPSAIARRWEARAELAGTAYHVRFDRDGSERDGIARSLDATGALILEDDAGTFVVDLADARVTRRR